MTDPLDDTHTISVPRGAKYLTAQMQRDLLTLWALVDPAAPLEHHTIRIVGVTATNFDEWCTDPRSLTFEEYMAEAVPADRGWRPPAPPAPPLRSIRL